MLLADIANGNVDTADVCFLIAIFTGLISAVLFLVVHTSPAAIRVAQALIGVTLALIALGFMVL